MTDEQINRAIAEACGWTDIDGLSAKGLMGTPPKSLCSFNYIPDYCADLNAMAEAEKVLTEHQRESIYPRMMGGWRNPAKPIYATARQRAEAFLRTLGKWEDATDKDSLTVQAATAEESSVVQDMGWPPPGTRCSRMNADGKWEEVQG